MDPTTQLQLPGGLGYLPWSDIQTTYPKLVKAIQKYKIERYYNYNPVTSQYMCKEDKELQLLQLMDIDINTVTLGNDPDAAAAAATVAKMSVAATAVYFTDKKRITAGSVFRDTPDVGDTTTIEEFLEIYPETAASFDGLDADARLDYFFKRHVKTTDEGRPIYIPVSKERRIMFSGLLDDEVEARDIV